MPYPEKNEKKSHFISRCIPMLLNEGKIKDPKQAAAICFSRFQEHNKSKSGDNIIDGLAEEFLKTKSAMPECPTCKSSAGMKSTKCDLANSKSYHCDTCGKNWISKNNGPLVQK